MALIHGLHKNQIAEGRNHKIHLNKITWDGFTHTMLGCTQGHLQQTHRLSRPAEPAQTPVLSCAQVSSDIQMDEAINYESDYVLHKKNCRYAHSIQRALHLEHLSCCYRGCIVHILHVHVRVDSNVIQF